jgi:hypothetical protein
MEIVRFGLGMSESIGRCFCSSRHTEEQYQGTWLLSLNLTGMRRRGIPHAMISTDWDNFRAYLFYANYGFTFLDRTFSFCKDLHDATPTSGC